MHSRTKMVTASIIASALVLLLASESVSSLRRRELRLVEEENELPSRNDDLDDLRFVTFGTSVTYGAMMDHPDEAYPYLLSKTVENKAMRASDSSYPSMCTQTMLANSIYDVIIIEYDRRRFECLSVFVKRLRQRYPDATIILTKLWNLMEVQVKEKGSEKKNSQKLREYLVQSGHPMLSKEALDYVLKLDNIEITFVDRLISRDNIFDKIAKENHAFVYEWDHDNSNIKDLLKFRFDFYADLVHPNDYGHRVIAKDIHDILTMAAKPIRSDRLGTWGEGDFCSSWFQSGKHDILANGQEALRSPSTPITIFDERNGKYAMELPTDKSTAMTIYNPFDGERKLYLTYMSSFPNRLYPKTAAYISGHDESTTVTIDPIAPYDFPVHVQDTKEVGYLKPGKNVLKMQPLTHDSEKPFRIVGFAITNGDFTPSDMYFKPEKLASKK